MGLDLKATVSLDGSGFMSGLRNIKQAAAAAFGIGGIEQIIHRTIDKFDELADASERLGVSVDFMQELGFAAKQSGVEIAQVVKFIEGINKNRGNGSAAWAKFGITPEMQATGSSQDIFRKIASSIRGQNAGSVVGSLSELGGGKASGAVIQLLNSFEQLRVEAHDLGAIVSGETVAQIKIAKDQLSGLADVLTAQLAPSIAEAMKEIAHGVNIVEAAVQEAKRHTGGTLGAVARSTIGTFTGGLGILDAVKRLEEPLRHFFPKFFEEVDKKNTSTDAATRNLANRLNNPAPPAPFPSLAARGQAGQSPGAADALIRVGNFIGTSKSTVERIGEQQVQLLQAIRNQLEVLTVKIVTGTIVSNI